MVARCLQASSAKSKASSTPSWRLPPGTSSSCSRIAATSAPWPSLPGSTTSRNLVSPASWLRPERFLRLGKLDDVRRAGTQTRPHEYRLPVGDYAIMYMTIDFGRLQFNVRPADSIRSAAESAEQPPLSSPLKIRKDAPCVLTFADRPTVTFTQPAKEAHYKPGDAVSIEAHLIDPTLNVLMGGRRPGGYKERLRHRPKWRKDRRTGALSPGLRHRLHRQRKLANGKMPFG